ncbi:hypothetical protein [uncultured Brevundimonas sp.]|uniref:hypothetical protein n=1 Tax=uncultured Brevundimonas sp. TaxID=213418 RepID=UPI0030EF0F7B|tara:strand:- start:2926 stop:3807 length:882 start_codon:yes stop_codon:yes gene_type:complete
MSAPRPSSRLVLIYGLLALLTVALGCLVCGLSGVAAASWLRNLIAWTVGAVAAGGLAAMAGRRTAMILLGVAVVVVGASLAGAPQQGVHRWLDLGPLHINVAFVALPAAVVALAWHRERRLAWGLVLAVQGLLVVQPDASQATAFGLALGVVALQAPLSTRLRYGIIGLATALAAASWLRPDPLEAIPEVEGIVGLAYAVSPVLALLAVVVLVATLLAPVLVAGSADRQGQTGGLALSAYFLTAAATTLFGAFPMPLLGVGMSPILGFWLGVGLLAATLRQSPGGAASPASGS